MNVGEVCNREVIVVAPGETLGAAGREMIERNVGTVVVCEDRGSGRRPVGILTDRDLMVALLGDGASARDFVGDAMTRDPLVLHADEPVEQSVERLRAHAVRRAPVVNAAGSLEGIVAVDDLVDLLAEQLGAIASLINRQTRRPRGNQ